MQKSPLAAAALAGTLFVTGALAGTLPPPPPPPAASADSEEDTTAFVGLNVVFGAGGQSVEGIIGVAHAETDADGDVTGAKASLHFGLGGPGGIGLSKAKLTALGGEEDLQGEAGIGWDFGAGGIIGVIGFNGNYYAGGADIVFGSGVEGYLGLHTIGEFEAPDTPAAPPPPT